MVIALRLLQVSRYRVGLCGFNSGLALWLALGVNSGFYHQIAALSAYNGLANVAFVLAVAVVVVCYYVLILQLLSWPLLAKPLACILIAINGLCGYFVHNLGIGINQNQLINAMQTNVHEAADLLSLQFVLWCCATIVLPWLVVGWIRLSPQSVKKTVLQKFAATALTLPLLLLLAFCYYGQLAPIFRQHRELKDLLSPLNGVSSLLSYAKQQRHSRLDPVTPYGTDATWQPRAPYHKPRLMVLVVGETARAMSFSLNGYARNTNPELGKLAAAGQLINFTRVTSCGTATAISVPCMFSGMPRQRYNASLAEQREGLLDIVQRAGYQVSWIDNNSDCKRTCLRVHSLAIPAMSQARWCHQGECDDQVLVESLADFLNRLQHQPTASNHLLVLHQMGSHGPAYYKRTRAGFQPFGPTCATNAIQNCTHEQLINSYDNTIVYTDHILASLIAQLQDNTRFDSALWYVSDHGESTGENGLYLHGTPYWFAPAQQTHIPMLMWFSPQWQSQRATLIRCLNSQKAAAISHDHLFATLLALLDIKSETSHHLPNLLEQCAA